MCTSEVQIPKGLIEKIVISVIICLLSLSIIGCGNNLSGKYVSESGVYSIEFSSNGTCEWHQNGLSFYGNYHWDSEWNRYYLEIRGSGSYADTEFTAIYLDSGELIVNGGKVNYETFARVSGADAYKTIEKIIPVFVIGIGIVIFIVLIWRYKTNTSPTVTSDTISFASDSKNISKESQRSQSDPSYKTIYCFNGNMKKEYVPSAMAKTVWMQSSVIYADKK